jgi:hypothetical protein
MSILISYLEEHERAYRIEAARLQRRARREYQVGRVHREHHPFDGYDADGVDAQDEEAMHYAEARDAVDTWLRCCAALERACKLEAYLSHLLEGWAR